MSVSAVVGAATGVVDFSFRLQPPRDGQGPLRGDLGGVRYLEMLGRLHRHLAVERYLEIGTRNGASLDVAAGGIAVCIDPDFVLARPSLARHREVHLYQTTSDAYFAARDPTAVLGGPVQFAFIDGMHHYEYVLRDIINVERHCASDSIIVLHDVVPATFRMTARLGRRPDGTYEPVTGSWTGDVWKVIPILRRHRPDLRITLLDCAPTGLALLGGLDPASRVLAERLPAILAERDVTPATPEELAAWLASEHILRAVPALETGLLDRLLGRLAG